MSAPEEQGSSHSETASSGDRPTQHHNPGSSASQDALRGLQRTKNTAYRQSGDFDHLVHLNQEVMDDLRFWISNLREANGRPIQFPVASITISSDASRGGWGAACGRVSMGGPWTKEESREHINYLELKAVCTTRFFLYELSMKCEHLHEKIHELHFM